MPKLKTLNNLQKNKRLKLQFVQNIIKKFPKVLRNFLITLKINFLRKCNGHCYSATTITNSWQSKIGKWEKTDDGSALVLEQTFVHFSRSTATNKTKTAATTIIIELEFCVVVQR